MITPPLSRMPGFFSPSPPFQTDTEIETETETETDRETKTDRETETDIQKDRYIQKAHKTSPLNPLFLKSLKPRVIFEMMKCYDHSQECEW